MLTLLLPLAAGFWVLVRAERAQISADETLRILVQAGFAEPVLQQYLKPYLGGGLPRKTGQLSLPRRGRSRWRRRRHRPPASQTEEPT